MHRLELRGIAQQALADEEAGGQLAVVTRRAHGDGKGLGFAGRLGAVQHLHLKRLLAGDEVLARVPTVRGKGDDALG